MCPGSSSLREAGIDFSKYEANYATIVTLRKLPNIIATTTTNVGNKGFNGGGNSGDIIHLSKDNSEEDYLKGSF